MNIQQDTSHQRSSNQWRLHSAKIWHKMMSRYANNHLKTRVITERTPATFVEQLEPRYLLSAEFLSIPPQQEESNEYFNMQSSVEETFVSDLSNHEVVNQNPIRELVFVDSAVSDNEALIFEALGHKAEAPNASGVEIVYLDANQDGVLQISQWISQYQDLQAIHIVSHGSSASVQLGNAVLDQANIERYADLLKSWNQSLSVGADLLFYGCEVAQGEEGKAFVNQIGLLTGADVAASKTLIGNSALGGNWSLEYTTGPIEAFSFFHVDLDYGHLLSTRLQNYVLTEDEATALLDALDLMDQAGNAALDDALLKSSVIDGQSVIDLLALNGVEFDFVESLGEYSGLDGKTLEHIIADLKNSTIWQALDVHGSPSFILSETDTGWIELRFVLDEYKKVESDLSFGLDDEITVNNVTATSSLSFDLVLAFKKASDGGNDTWLQVNEWNIGTKLSSNSYGFVAELGLDLTLYDPDNRDKLNRVYLNEFDTEMIWLRKVTAELSAIDGNTHYIGKLSNNKLSSSAWTNGTLTLAHIEQLRTIFADMQQVGSQLDQLEALGVQLPLVDVSLAQLMVTEDGRTLGDILSFAYYKNGTTWTTVLDDFLAAGGTTYQALMTRIADYLHGRGDYEALQGLIPNDFSDSPFVIGGGIVDGELHFDLSLALSREFLFAAAMGDRLEAIGFSWGDAQGLPLAASIRVDMAHRANGLSYSNFSISASQQTSHFTTAGLLGAVPIQLHGQLGFDSGSVTITVSGPTVSGHNSSAAVLAWLDFEIAGDLFGTELSTIAGGIPKVIMDWRDGVNAVPWSELYQINPTLELRNLAPLSTISAMGPNELLGMLSDLLFYLENLRDSGQFDGVLPFTDINLGLGLDFSEGLARLLNNDLQAAQQSVFASEIISPVLARDLSFDITFQRPGESRPQVVTVVVRAAATASFTHIQQLAEYIETAIAEAANGLLTLYQRNSHGLLSAASGSAITVSAQNLDRQTNNSIHGSLVFSQRAVGTFDVLRITPTGGINLEVLQSAQAGETPRAAMHRLQLIHVGDSVQGGGGTFTLSFRFDGQDISTTAIDLNTPGIISERIQLAINTAIGKNSTTGVRVVVSASNGQSPIPGALNQGIQSFDIIVDGSEVLGKSFTNLTADPSKLLATPGVQAHVTTLRDGMIAVADRPALAEVQRLSFDLIGGGNLRLAMNVGGQLYLSEVVDWAALSAASLEIAVLQVLRQAIPSLNSNAVRVIEVDAGKHYDVYFEGVLLGENLPQLRINATGLAPVQVTASSGEAGLDDLTRLGFALNGASQQLAITPNFITWQELAAKLQLALDANSDMAGRINGIEESHFQLNPRFDLASNSVLFDLILGSGVRIDAATLIAGSEDLSGLSLEGQLDITHEAYFKATFGFDLNQTNRISIQAGGSPLAEIIGSFMPPAEGSETVSFSLVVDGKSYARVSVNVDSDTSLSDVIKSLNSQLADINTSPGDPLHRRGFSNLREAIAFSQGDNGEVVLRAIASVGEIGFVNVSNALLAVLGIAPAPIFPSPDFDSRLPANGRLSSDATFQLIIDNGAAVTVTVPKSATDNNNSVFDLIADIQAALNALDVSGHNWLGSVLGHQKLGDLIRASFISDQVDSPWAPSNGELAGFLELQVTDPRISRIQIAIPNEGSEGIRQLGLSPGQSARAVSSGMFVIDAMVGGRFSGEIHGQEDSAAKSSFPEVDFITSASATLGMLNVSFDTLRIDTDKYQGSFVYAIGLDTDGPNTRYDLNRLIDATLPQSMQLGFSNDFNVRAGGSVTSLFTPFDQSGQIIRDVGLTITLTQGSQEIALEAVVRDAATRSNALVADLAADVNNAIQAALEAWATANNTINPHAEHIFVRAVTENGQQRLQFVAPSGVAMSVANRLLMDEFTSQGLVWSDLAAELRLDGVQVEVLDGMSQPTIDDEVVLTLENLEESLLGTEAARSQVSLPDFGELDGLATNDWGYLLSELTQLPQLLGNLANMGEFQLLNQALPLLNKSLNNLFNLQTAFSKVVGALHTFKDIGLLDLQQAFEAAFGTGVGKVSVRYDASQQALLLDIPFSVTIERMEQLQLLLDDPRLTALLPPEQRELLQSLLGDAQILSDIERLSLLPLIGQVDYNIRLGIDLSRGTEEAPNPNLGRLFLVDHQSAGGLGIEDDTGTFATLRLQIDSRGTLFSEVSLVAGEEAAREIRFDARDFSRDTLLLLQVAGEMVGQQLVIAGSTAESVATAFANSLGVNVSANGNILSIAASEGWGNSGITLWAFAAIAEMPASQVAGNSITLAESDIAPGRVIELMLSNGSGSVPVRYLIGSNDTLQSVTSELAQRIAAISGLDASAEANVITLTSGITVIIRLYDLQGRSPLPAGGGLNFVSDLGIVNLAVQNGRVDLDLAGQLKLNASGNTSEGRVYLEDFRVVRELSTALSAQPRVQVEEGNAMLSIVDALPFSFDKLEIYTDSSTERTLISNQTSSSTGHSLTINADDLQPGRLIALTLNDGRVLFQLVGSNPSTEQIAQGLATQIIRLLRNSPNQFKNNLFEVNLDGRAEAVLPLSLSLSDQMADLVREFMPGFKNPMPLGTLEAVYNDLARVLLTKAGGDVTLNQLISQAARPAPGEQFGVGDVAPDGTPVDTADESALPGFNPNPWNDATGGEGQSTTPSTGTTLPSMPGGSAPSQQPARDSGVDIQIITPNLVEWVELVREILLTVTGPDCDPQNPRPTNGPLLFLLSDPSTVLNAIDTVFSTIERGIDAITGAIVAPIIGDGLNELITFVSDLRKGLFDALNGVIEQAQFKYGAIDNAFRMAMFDIFHHPNNPFLNFLRDYNGDGMITPDDIVVEYVAPDTTERQLNIDSRLSSLLEPEQLWAILNLADSGQRLAWVASGERTPKADENGNLLFLDPMGQLYVKVGSEYRLGHHEGAVVALSEEQIGELSFCFEGVAGDIVLDLDFKALLEGFWVKGDSSSDFEIVDESEEGARWVEFTKQQKEAARGIALSQASALQYRLNLGQTIQLPSLNAAFDVGVPGLNLQIDGGIGVTLDWDFYLGFGIDLFQGFYLIADMPNRAGIGQLTLLDENGIAIDIVDADVLRDPHTNDPIINDDGEEISLDPHIGNLWGLGDDDLAANIQFQVHAYLEGSQSDFFQRPVRDAEGNLTGALENVYYNDLFVTDEEGNYVRDNDGNLIPLPVQAPATMSAELLFLRGTVTDNFSGWIKDNEGRIWGDREAWENDTKDGPWSADYDTFAAFGGETLFDGKTGHEGSRTQFLARFEINLTDNVSLGLGSDIFGDVDFFDGAGDLFDDLFKSSDGRITKSVLINNDFDDLWETNWEAWAQINLHMRLGVDIAGQGFLPAIDGNFHLTWSASKEDPDQPEWQAWLERFEQMGKDDYGTLFVDAPGVWITDITLDMGTFFSNFLTPVLDLVTTVTGPIQPIIDQITRPIPGISQIMRKNYSIVDMAVDFAKFSGGNAKVDFIVSMINLVNTINSISQMNSSLQIPITESLILAGNPHGAFGLDDILKYVGVAADFLTPSIPAIPGETTIGLDQGMSDFLAEFDDPKNALRFPIVEDPFTSVLGLLLGQPVDLMTFTPPNLEVGVGVRKAFPVYGPLFVGLRGEINLSAAITLGFDTYGVMKSFETGNWLDVLDGFYISDNVINGIDRPEVVLNATLAAFAELNGGIVRGGVEGGIEFIGELDLCDPDQDGRVRGSEIASLLGSGNTFITMEMYANAFIRAYLEVLALVKYVRVFELTFVNIELFRWSVGSCDQDPILASRDGTSLILHAGSGVGSIDGFDAITKTSSDRERRSTDDGNEHFIISGNSSNITVQATLPNGQTYTQQYSGSLVRGYTGAGTDIFDASQLNGVSVFFVAGSGNNTLIASNASGNVLIGGTSGTTTLIGGSGDDLLIARGATTLMEGGAGADTYRFLGNWGNATISDLSGANIIDFSAQNQGVTISDAGQQALQGTNQVIWAASTVDLIKGGSGADHIDFSGNSQNLTVTLTGTNQGWVTNSRSGMTQSALPTSGGSGQSNSGQGYRFESIEHITGGRGSDVVRVQNGASISGSLRMSTGNDLANARNTLDFSEFTIGVTIDLLGNSSFGVSNGVVVRGFHNVFGGSGNDTLIGNGLNNLLVGNGGRDQLSAVGGHNLLVADNFNTYLNGSSGPGVIVSDYVSLQLAGVAGGHGGDGRMWLWKGKTIESRDVGSRTNQSLRGSGGNDILLGGLGNDTIISGEGNNTILGDLGRVMVDFNFNVPLFLESFGNVGGGSDTIQLGTGNNIVIGGNGSDTITSRDSAQSFNIVLADNGVISFRTSGGTFAVNSLGQRMLNYVVAPENENGGTGGDNTVLMGSGSAIIFGGAGNDVITMTASTSTAQNSRYIAGDHARIETDENGGIILFKSLSTSNTSGGSDFIAIGDGADSYLRHLGSNFIIGGVGGDTILTSAHQDVEGNLVRGEAHSMDVIIGDVGQIRWYNSSSAQQTPNRLYQVVGGFVGDELEHDRRHLGGNNIIHTGNGDRYIIGGFGDDVISAAVVSNDATGNATRVIAGDHARIDFDGLGNMVLFRSLDTEAGTGGNDFIRIGSGSDSAARYLGSNFIIGGMGSDTILISAHFNQDGQLIQGQASSEDVIIGANGLIERTHATSSRPNLMLRVETIEDDKGGDDRIHTAHGGKVILGGFGNDLITALDGIHIVFGDSARLLYDNVANNGVLRLAESKSTVLGGSDMITLGDGYKLVGGGIGSDTITINATTTPEARGIEWNEEGGFLAGVTGIAAVAFASGGILPGITLTQERGRSGRFVAGDNVRAVFDSQGGLTNLVTIDQISATGGADTIVIGRANTTANLGLNVLFGGMGADQIRVQPGSYAENIIFGDNGQFNRQPLNYAMQSLLSTQTSAGGSNDILTGSGDNIIIGGFAGDSIRVDSSSVRAALETDGFNRAIVLGDSGEIRFVGGNLERIDSIAHASGGNDQVTIGDGDVVFVGGHGGDSLQVNSNESAFRIAAGDNAELRFSPTTDPRNQAASLVRLTTLDQVSATGGNDIIRIGVAGVNTGDMGEVIVVGGVGSDDIRISGGIARATLLGDNGQIERIAGHFTGSSNSGQRVSVTSLTHTLGAGGVIHTVAGDYVILGGSGGDQIRAGKGTGVVFGDHGQVLYTHGVLSSVTSVGITQGGDDHIELGAGIHFDSQGIQVVDGRQIVVGGFGADQITLNSNRGSSLNPIERAIAGDNVTMAFDDQGRLTDFTTLDSSIATGGNDSIQINMVGERDSLEITDYNVIAGGMGNANINVQGQSRSSNVISGDNLDYRRLINTNGQRQHLSATVPEPTVGGNDTIRVGSGEHIIFGGAGSDTITANTEAGDTSILFGDAGTVLFDNSGNGRLQQLLTIADESGGSDTLSVERGDLYLFAGAGADTVRVTSEDINATRIIAGWGAQVNFDSNGSPELVQSRGPTNVPSNTADNQFNLSSSGLNFVLGGAGFTSLIGSEGNQHRFLPGSGSINLQSRVVSVVVLGDDGDLGMRFDNEYASGLPDANGLYALRPGADFVRPPVPPTDPNDPNQPSDPKDPEQPGDFTYFGTGTVTEDSANRVNGRIAYPALEGGLATFDPQRNSQQGDYGYLTMGEDGSWRYDLGFGSNGFNESINQRVQTLRDGDLRTEYFSVTTRDGSTTTITITVEGRNDTPSNSIGNVSEDGVLEVTGIVTDPKDISGRTRFEPKLAHGNYGQLLLNADGSWRYILNNDSDAVQQLRENQEVVDAFVINTVDGSTATIAITVTGANDIASISGQFTGSVTEDATDEAAVLIAQGQIRVNDIDANEDRPRIEVIASEGALGSLIIDAQGRWQYSVLNSAIWYLNAGETKVEHFTITSWDGSANETITITIQGVNNPAQISGNKSGLVFEGGTQRVAGQLNIFDPDTGQSMFVATQMLSNFGSLVLQDNGVWQYQLNSNSQALRNLNQGVRVIDAFVVSSVDGTQTVISIEILGSSGLLQREIDSDFIRSTLNPLIISGSNNPIQPQFESLFITEVSEEGVPLTVLIKKTRDSGRLFSGFGYQQVFTSDLSVSLYLHRAPSSSLLQMLMNTVESTSSQQETLTSEDQDVVLDNAQRLESIDTLDSLQEQNNVPQTSNELNEENQENEENEDADLLEEEQASIEAVELHAVANAVALSTRPGRIIWGWPS